MIHWQVLPQVTPRTVQLHGCSCTLHAAVQGRRGTTQILMVRTNSLTPGTWRYGPANFLEPLTAASLSEPLPTRKIHIIITGVGQPDGPSPITTQQLYLVEVPHIEFSGPT